MKKSNLLATLIRTSTFLIIFFSIVVTHYVMVVQLDYTIFTNPEGPETADYFEELFAI